MSLTPTPSRYRLLRRIGAGGMAEVWKASVTGLRGFERVVALKRVLPELATDAGFLKMFMEEAQVSAQLHHANIVQVFDLGELDGRLFLAMEYLEGRDAWSLMNALVSKGPPDPGLGALVGREVCRALAYVHRLADAGGRSLGLVHRDVSPNNIMITYDGAVKLLDFGVAKALQLRVHDQSTTGSIKGKLAYVAPELFQGSSPDHRVDLFAAGVVLHEMLAGRRLFGGRPDIEIIQRVQHLEIPLPSSINPSVPAALDRICQRALQRDPELRYQSAEEMGEELERVVVELGWTMSRLATLLGETIPRDARAAEPGSPTRTLPQREDGPRPHAPELGSASPRSIVRNGLVAALVVALVSGVIGFSMRKRLGAEEASRPASAVDGGLASRAADPPPSPPVEPEPVVVAPSPPTPDVREPPTGPRLNASREVPAAKAGKHKLGLGRGKLVDPFR